MTVVRFKNRPNGVGAFNNLIGDVFPQMPSLYRDEFKQQVPVNIKETEKEFLIELVVPGMNKEDFGISLDDNLLTVSTAKKEEIKNDAEKLVRSEFKLASFKRSFTIDKKVNTEGIVAQYVNGILKITLPKKEEAKSVTKNITIA